MQVIKFYSESHLEVIQSFNLLLSYSCWIWGRHNEQYWHKYTSTQRKIEWVDLVSVHSLLSPLKKRPVFCLKGGVTAHILAY